jgi:hypothetical protein
MQKGKVVPKRYAMVTYAGSGCVDPRFLDLGSSWK